MEGDWPWNVANSGDFPLDFDAQGPIVHEVWSAQPSRGGAPGGGNYVEESQQDRW